MDATPTMWLPGGEELGLAARGWWAQGRLRFEDCPRAPVTGIFRRSQKIVGVRAAVGTLIPVIVITIHWSAQPRIGAGTIGAWAVGNPVAGPIARP